MQQRDLFLFQRVRAVVLQALDGLGGGQPLFTMGLQLAERIRHRQFGEVFAGWRRRRYGRCHDGFATKPPEQDAEEQQSEQRDRHPFQFHPVLALEQPVFEFGFFDMPCYHDGFFDRCRCGFSRRGLPGHGCLFDRRRRRGYRGGLRFSFRGTDNRLAAEPGFFPLLELPVELLLRLFLSSRPGLASRWEC